MEHIPKSTWWLKICAIWGIIWADRFYCATSKKKYDLINTDGDRIHLTLHCSKNLTYRLADDISSYVYDRMAESYLQDEAVRLAQRIADGENLDT